MKKAINAGKYRHQIVIKAAAADSSRDTYGRRKGTGSTVATVWAEKQDWSGDESTENGRETATVTTKWIIRHRTDLSSGMTVTHGAVVYDILSILDFDGTGRELVLNCRKVVDS